MQNLWENSLHFLISFLQLGEFLQFMGQNHQSTGEAIQQFIALPLLKQLQIALPPLLPSFFILETLMMLGRWTLKKSWLVFQVPFLTHVFNRLVSLVLVFDIGGWANNFFQPYALLSIPYTWWGIIIAFMIWELGHFIFHYSSHRVRLLWCFHAPHHAPEHMGLIVIYSNHFIQALYAQLCRVTICVLLGLDVNLLLICMTIDFCWGGLIHFDEALWKSGRTHIQWLDNIFLMPIHHRIHHACNPEYIDKNYCNTLPIWDKLFGTLQNEVADVKIRYGLARPINSHNFLDAHFGDLFLLFKDISNANNIKEVLGYIFMPPNWKPTSMPN